MSLNEEFTRRLHGHRSFRKLENGFFERVDRIEKERLAERGPGADHVARAGGKDDDDSFLGRAAIRFEHVALEGRKALCYPTAGNAELRALAVAASYKAFGLRRLMPITSKGYMRLDQVLHNSSLAICGGRRAELLQWYADNGRTIAVPYAPGSRLDRYMLYKNYDCWIRLFRARGARDLAKVRKVIAKMIEAQAEHEGAFVERYERWERRGIGVELMAYYLWSSATGRLADCLLSPGTEAEVMEMDKDFEAAKEAADLGGHKVFVVLLDYLHAAAKTMVCDRLS